MPDKRITKRQPGKYKYKGRNFALKPVHPRVKALITEERLFVEATIPHTPHNHTPVNTAPTAIMTEPRQRAARHKGQLNFGPELRQMLYAFGDDKDPLDETVRVLDEIVTDYIIETAHTAARVAEYSGRQKIKNEDFNFAIRKDEYATGRVKELHTMEKKIRDDRKQFDTGEGKVGLERGGRKKKEDKAEEPKVVGKGKGKEVLDETLDDDEEMGDLEDY